MDITVAGLLTGKDIIEQLSGRKLGKYLLIARNMLRAGETVFLDDLTVGDLERDLKVIVKVVDNDGASLIDLIMQCS